MGFEWLWRKWRRLKRIMSLGFEFQGIYHDFEHVLHRFDENNSCALRNIGGSRRNISKEIGV